MYLKNYTPFAGNAWENLDANGKWHVTSLLRLKFKLMKGDEQGEWKLKLLPEQGDLFGADIFFDKERMGSVQYESDYVPFKPCADLVVNATAIFPNAQEGTNWSCGVTLYSPTMQKLNELRLRVKASKEYGVRKATNRIPIRYEYAKGGVLSQKKDEEGKLVPHKVNHYNPVGCGKYRHREEDEACSEQIFYTDGVNLKVPPGFGFIHRSWKSRLALAGTYDQEWIDNQHPLPPHDFNFLHNQAAHPLLIAKDYIEAGSRIELDNLIAEEPLSYFTVPEFKLLSRVTTQTRQELAVLMLDTLLIDLDGDKEEYHLYASYRAYTPLFDKVEQIELILIEEEGE